MHGESIFCHSEVLHEATESRRVHDRTVQSKWEAWRGESNRDHDFFRIAGWNASPADSVLK
jgi:hypothetical protein